MAGEGPSHSGALLTLLVSGPEGRKPTRGENHWDFASFSPRYSARFPLGLPATMPGRMWVQYSTSAALV